MRERMIYATGEYDSACCTAPRKHCPFESYLMSCSGCIFYKKPEKKNKKLPKRDSKGRFCSSYKAPKLTEEVFNKPNCPKWAQWAAVDAKGDGWWFEDEPLCPDKEAQYRGYLHWYLELGSTGRYSIISDMEFDATNWEHSLIERPKKAPERGFYYSPFKDLYYYIGLNKDPYKALICGSNGDYEDLPTDAYKIKKQSYSEEELIGKVVKISKGYTPIYYVITGGSQGLISLGAHERPIEKAALELDYTFKDGSPCFKVLPQ